MLGFRSSLPPVFTVRPDPWQWWQWVVLGYDEVNPCHGYRCVAVIEPGMAYVIDTSILCARIRLYVLRLLSRS